MDEFLDRMLMERRTLDQALADLLVRQNRIPYNRRRNMLEHMIDGLKAEIALRTTATGVAKGREIEQNPAAFDAFLRKLLLTRGV